ncbi:hypothetical protein [Kitasatospora sp. NPDC007106]|uniref:hypothetical protein n=1 Tax=Kitasatospora sp. NPDC007106 TaxID=3156914 RepID=UPI0033EE1D9F
MPHTADRHAPATPAAPAPRRRRRAEQTPRSAADALQRALDRRDNGGVTGHHLG